MSTKLSDYPQIRHLFTYSMVLLWIYVGIKCKWLTLIGVCLCAEFVIIGLIKKLESLRNASLIPVMILGY